MSKLVFAALLMFSSFAFADAPSNGIDNTLDHYLAPIATVFTQIIFYAIPFAGTQVPLIVIWLIIAASVFTAYFGFLNFKGFNHAVKVIKGDYSNPNDPGEVSHFQALTTALSGTVGLGNIAGVAIAVSIGGPGATFWMIVAGLLGMSTKFLECTLGVKYRQISPSGKVHGGPMYYLRDGLAGLGYHKAGKFLAVFFAICCVIASLCGSNMLQSNQAFMQFSIALGSEPHFFSDKGWLFGFILALIIGFVIIGGIKSIAKVTEKVVPLMAGVYLAAALFVLLWHFEQLPAAISLIFKSAFVPEGVVGGMVGVIIQGFKRATFSCEAGVGAASIAHATASTKEPIREGYVALLEPFIDTVVICTITALVIVITGAYTSVDGIDGVALTSRAFASVIWWFPYLLSLAVLLFAISTMISWAYYGSIAWGFLVGNSRLKDLSYKLIFCIFTAIGASVSLESVIAISDSMFFSMAIANIIGLYLLAPQVKQDLKRYQMKYLDN
ncbi:alanine/glycine:cation symporter family protein [Pseudoalteromonas tunicata]|uniref:alanine/glycine:cation symporter family protein n=1 Tax=Pseudoalteromonas tunicata TaxID=314281 RepID=UPI00273E0510|nr:alanine/glycine:cation symporter family protein [Pseudoalteromonas tunicata]MDP5214226.1 alanine/glycine:cation symporter family protein [Pseudoalteromonas tunicata]